MVPHPLKLLLTGYGVALALAIGMLWAGLGWVAAALGFWLAGPLLVVAIGATPRLNRRFIRRIDALAEEAEAARWRADLEAEAATRDLREWEADLRAEILGDAQGLRAASDRALRA